MVCYGCVRCGKCGRIPDASEGASCPSCGATVNDGYPECPECGFRFPPKPGSTTASDGDDSDEEPPLDIKPGDYVVHGTDGVCKVLGTARTTISSSCGMQTYYVLSPLENAKTRIYVPFGSKGIGARMRRVPSKKEIDGAILSSVSSKMAWSANFKEREARFREILIKRDEQELLSMIACLRSRQESGSSSKLSREGVRVLKAAESIIDREFAFSLGIDERQVEQYIKTEIEKAGRSKRKVG